MNITLQEYSNKADLLHQDLLSSDFLATKKILSELETYIKCIQSVSFKIAIIYNKFKTDIKNSNYGQLVEKDKKSDDDLQYISKNVSNTEVSPGIFVDTIVLKTVDQIPNSQLYWIESISQFAFKINNVLFRGNIGNIFEKLVYAYGYIKCKDANKCKHILKKRKCRYYHDPLELYNDTKISIKNGEQYIKNFSQSSWLYTSDSRKKKNMNMRRIGNRNTLSTDLEILKMDSNKHIDVDNLLNQSMHDLLTILCMDKYNLIPADSIVPIKQKNIGKLVI